MNPPAMDMESLGQRLGRLERENWRLKRLGGLMLLGFAAVVLMGQATPRKVAKVIEAEEFILRDGTGKERAAMRVLADGSASLALWNKDRKGLAALGMTADGNPTFGFWDKDGKSRAVLGMTAEGNPVFGFLDKDEKERAKLALGNDGSPGLVLRDEKERIRAVLGHTNLEITRTGSVEQRSASSLVLFDKDGKVMWTAP